MRSEKRAPLVLLLAASLGLLSGVESFGLSSLRPLAASGGTTRGIHGTALRRQPSGFKAPLKIRGGSEIRMGAELTGALKTGALVYAVLMGAGGVVAGLKTGSKPSMIAGSASAVILVLAYLKSSLVAAFGTAVALSVVFGIRLAKTKKFMPAGFLGAISVAFSALFGSAYL
mmetsp:Transcript_44017/g.68826  ORF Transcript_44017/g.68826 Transcript_44017/m.68826 type:complete len:172 (+) Transcript_44017:94-609(+)